MSSYVPWLQSTWPSQWIQQSTWVWPFCETLHFVGLTLLIGLAGVFDLRLMGFLKRVPMVAVMEFMPWAVAGFFINLVTGTIFFIGHPELYSGNPAWWGKVTSLLIAGFNAIFFQIALSKKMLAAEPGQEVPFAFKAVGAISLLAWFGVLYFGRMLPYLGGGSGG
ncbi:MAG TPA: DUF6644 family protein [Terriglobales bacterium]|nr:DUF6644 family protein [Terriglobales bacterium]